MGCPDIIRTQGTKKNLHGKLGKLDKLRVDFANFANFVMHFFIHAIFDFLDQARVLPLIIPPKCRVRRFEVMTKTRSLLARQRELHRTAPIEPQTINELQKAMKNLSRACINPCTTSRAALVWCCILCYASPVANSLRLRFTPGPPLQLYVRFF